METMFKTTLIIRKKEGGGPVYHKQDGERFDQRHTVKMNVNTVYDVKVTFRPALQLQKLMIQGENHKFDMEKNKQNCDEDSSTYVVEYDTSVYDISKRTKRKDLPILFEFHNGVYMKMTLQCKFYPECETEHCHWGQPLTTLDMDCKTGEGQNFARVEKQKFL